MTDERGKLLYIQFIDKLKILMDKSFPFQSSEVMELINTITKRYVEIDGTIKINKIYLQSIRGCTTEYYNNIDHLIGKFILVIIIGDNIYSIFINSNTNKVH